MTIWDVISTMEGAKKPPRDRHDRKPPCAMAFGAIDPGSGTTVMMQDADAFKKLHDAGWHPDRTIEISSWDARELGLGLDFACVRL